MDALPAPFALEQDGISVRFDGRQGYTISVDGIPFSSSAQLSLTDPAWRETYYAYSTDSDRLRQVSDQLKARETSATTRLLISLRDAKSDVAVTTQTFEILPGRRLRISVDTVPTSSAAIVLENRLASIGENWIAHRPFRAKLSDGSTTSGRTPAWPVSPDMSKSRVVNEAQTLAVETPYGPVEIETSGTTALTLMDYRLNRWADGKRYFWLGVTGVPVPVEGHHYETTFQFAPKQVLSPPPSLSMTPDVQDRQVIYRPENPPDKLLPTPKSLEWRTDDLPLNEGVSLLLSEKLSKTPGVADVVDYYHQRWQQRFGFSVRLGEASGATTASVAMLDHRDLSTAQAEEAYELDVSGAGLQVKIRTAVGLRHALSTVEQIMRHGPDGKLRLRGAQIFDYPALPFRGIHAFSGKNAGGLQQKMIREIIAPLKLNKLIYQVDYVEWDTLGEPHHPRFSMTKSEAQQVGDAATSAGLEVIPLLNTFGHSEWLLKRPAFRHLADDPAQPYSYDPSNPEVYRLCEQIYDEVISMFRPSMIHIGHDEVTMNGFPQKPANKKVPVTDLLMKDIRHYRDFLSERGIRTMIWGDMFLGPGESPDACLADSVEEASRRRHLLPKDIILADWHYEPAASEAYKSLKIFTDAGFETIACTWNQPHNVVNFAAAAEAAHRQTTSALGLMQTTWAGYSFDQESLRQNLDQYAFYVLAAEAAWTGGQPEAVHLDYRSEFLNRWNTEPTELRGWQADLSSAANLSLDRIAAAALGCAADAFEGLVPGENSLRGNRFLLAHSADKNAASAGAIITSGALEINNLPASTELLLAIASAQAWPDQMVVGRVIIQGDDGATTTTDLVYGQNIFSVTESRQTLDAPTIWTSKNRAINQGSASIRQLKIRLPSNSPVKSIQLIPEIPMELIVFGVNGRSGNR